MDGVAVTRTQAPLLVIVGSTATGKTDLTLALARELSVEVVVADSRQVYRGMDIGTAKPDVAAQAIARHHLIDLVAPDAPFSVADWVAAAREVIPHIDARGSLPLIVGGTGLYVSALLDGYDLASVPPSPELRDALQQVLATEGLAALAARLVAIDPEAGQRVDRSNPRRLIRAIERGGQRARENRPWTGRAAVIGLHRPRAVLDARINARAEALFAGGLLDEVGTLMAAGYGEQSAPMSGHGYGEAARHLAGEWSLERAVEVTARRTRQYARRQETWFRRDARITWLELEDRPADEPAVVAAARAVADELLAPQG
jgi:tRNA dimethylallyltransferase